jgi:hypothetical protein
MSSSGMLRRAALLRTDVSKELISELGTTLAVTTKCVLLLSLCRLLVTANVVPRLPILVILMLEALYSSKTSALARATQRNIPVHDILYI